LLLVKEDVAETGKRKARERHADKWESRTGYFLYVYSITSSTKFNSSEQSGVRLRSDSSTTACVYDFYQKAWRRKNESTFRTRITAPNSPAPAVEKVTAVCGMLAAAEANYFAVIRLLSMNLKQPAFAEAMTTFRKEQIIPLLENLMATGHVTDSDLNGVAGILDIDVKLWVV
jgi:hypothetical protein